MATKGMQTRFEYGDTEDFNTATSWTGFAKVIEIGPPPITADDIETTHLQSPDDFKEFDPGLADAGDSTFKIQWEKAQNTTLYNLFREKKGYRIVYADVPYPSGSKTMFNGWIKGIAGETITKDSVVEATITVRVVGKPEFVEAGA